MNILLVILIFILLASCAGLALSLYLFFKRDNRLVVIDRYSMSSTTEGMSLSTSPKYTLKKKDLNKSHVVMNGDHKIIVPSSSSKWNGTITISNLQDVTDTLDVKAKSRIRIIEYDNKTTIYGGVENFNGKYYNYDKVKGTIDLNNYTATLYFTGGLVNIDIHTLIMPSDPILS